MSSLPALRSQPLSSAEVTMTDLHLVLGICIAGEIEDRHKEQLPGYQILEALEDSLFTHDSSIGIKQEAGKMAQ